MRTSTNQDGITLLITLLLMGVLLGISASLLNITLKQFQLSGIAYASEAAFQAANSGMECALFYDFPKTGVGPFDVPGDGDEQDTVPTISCMGLSNVESEDYDNGTFDDPDAGPSTAGDGITISGGEQRFKFAWDNSACTEVSVYKFYSDTVPVNVTVNNVSMRSAPCPAGSVCTVIQSRGYNVACAEVLNAGRVVEREYTQVY